MPHTTPLQHLGLPALRRWLVTARADIAAYAAVLNELNVFPVPDGDTGSNLLLTMTGALEAVDAQAPTDLTEAAQALSTEALIAAHGNSGAIISQLARGVADVLVRTGGAELDGHDLASALSRAAQLARDSVARPEPGTMISVAGAAASAAVAADAGAAQLAGVIDAAVAAASDALLRTRTEHPVLRQAGVVDAGGAGYLLVLEALQRVVRGAGGLPRSPEGQPQWLQASGRGSAIPTTTAARTGTCPDHDPERFAAGPAYEVMFLLADTDQDAVRALRSTLGALGDSLVVAGASPLWSVHVHTDDVAAVVNAAVEAGRAHRFSVSRFADSAPPQEADTAVLAVVSSPTLASTLRDGGHQVLLAQDADLADGVPGSDAASPTLVICETDEGRRAAQQAFGSEVEVVGGDAAQVLAAMSVVDPAADRQDTVRTVHDTIDDLRSRQIRRHELDAGSDTDVVAELTRLAAAFLAECAGGRELLTVVGGANLTQEQVRQIAQQLQAAYPDLQPTVVDASTEGTAAPAPEDVLLTLGVE